MEDDNVTDSDNDASDDNEHWRLDCEYSIEENGKNFPTNNVIGIHAIHSVLEYERFISNCR